MKDNNETEFFRNITVQFPVQGQKLPADHGYLLYSAISGFKPELHETGWLAVEMISGMPFDKGLITLPRNAELRLRIPGRNFHANFGFQKSAHVGHISAFDFS